MGTNDNLTRIHDRSSHNRTSLLSSAICGCFYCLNEFAPSQIVEWVGKRETALCPICGIDSVLGFEISPADRDLLRRMHDRWFSRTVSFTEKEWQQAVETGEWPKTAAKAVKPK